MNLPRKNKELGFTLVDILVATAIMVFMCVILVANFSRGRVNLSESASIIIGAIRRAETKAISSSQIAGVLPCGYGVIYNNARSVSIYAGPELRNDPSSYCDNNKYGIGYSKIETITLIDPRAEIRSANDVPPYNVFDIFFRPPDPRTYLNGTINPSTAVRIIIARVDKLCTAGNFCQTLCVYGTGRIETYQNQVPCP